LTSILGVVMALSGGAVALFGIYLLALALASLFGRPKPTSDGPEPSHQIAVLVPAHDEEQLIGRCVESLLAQSYPHDLYRVIVIADNCSDRTADNAEAAGAEVIVRDEPNARGKGQALRWAMDRLLAAPNPPDAVVVVDADSIADHNLLRALKRQVPSVYLGPQVRAAGAVASAGTMFAARKSTNCCTRGSDSRLAG
jgi:cellulose synthase/poly-beta-1,6-N-acetylglucosamine synthase-like glycosyltransferase